MFQLRSKQRDVYAMHAILTIDEYADCTSSINKGLQRTCSSHLKLTLTRNTASQLG